MRDEDAKWYRMRRTKGISELDLAVEGKCPRKCVAITSGPAMAVEKWMFMEMPAPMLIRRAGGWRRGSAPYASKCGA